LVVFSANGFGKVAMCFGTPNDGDIQNCLQQRTWDAGTCSDLVHTDQSGRLAVQLAYIQLPTAAGRLKKAHICGAVTVNMPHTLTTADVHVFMVNHPCMAA
jgi:hypothetical protein